MEDINHMYGWPSSRIVRVSRASGGKDRHSKVWTSKGLRDRRVRLSVSTAIQFYDLQDRLGYDQPSKAVEWLLKAAASSISELPELNGSFVESTKDISDEKGSKSGCSSASETSKGSGLSLTRSESRVKARERARGRALVKEKEKEKESGFVNLPHNSSFTELLTGGNNSTSIMDYFTNGISTSSTPFHQQQQQQQFCFVPDNAVQDNVNFTISSGVGGYNRGTLQSNTSSVFPIDGSNLPLFVENHHTFSPGFDGRLELYYGSHSDNKGKGKN